MIKISIFLSHSLVAEDLLLKDKNAVVIDVLRAGSTMTVALSNGAKEVIPAENVTKAAKINRGSSNSMLCGERNGKLVVGFDFGNSPLEFTQEKVKGKTLIFSTTNGTVSIVKSRLTKNCVIGSFLNISKIVEYILSVNQDFYLLCAGKLNNFCIEDFVFAGAVIKEILKVKSDNINIELNDPEYTALKLAELLVYKNDELSSDLILDMFKISEHGKFLISLGFEKDLEICSRINTYPFLPIFSKDIIKLKEQIELETSQRMGMKKINLSGKNSNDK
ncbi:MAG: 2-phosphosulfolactate phosphatase [Ignavibacteria bacterium]|nr:2-phosphosulfolactate phosphatase [Ignavibacteria bacterium]